jgi:Flp pilus assembly pilin Flp
MNTVLRRLHILYADASGQGVAEYAIMLVVVLTLAMGAVHAIGSHANEVFSRIASAIE